VTAVSTTHLTAALQSAGLLHEVRGELPLTVTGITDDSRTAVPGGAFVAVRGRDQDGHDYLAAAERAGVVCAIVEPTALTDLPSLVVTNSRRAAAASAAAYYNDPSRSLTCFMVTGTNGKTTTVGLLRHLFDRDDAHAASIGTLGVLVGSVGREFPSLGELTTPGPVELQRVLRGLVDSGVRTVAIEGSSHALDQNRLDGIQFAAVVFTNLTRDHLDYHRTMDAYFASKARAISLLGPDGVAVVNADAPVWNGLPRALRRVTYGQSPDADVRASYCEFTPQGSVWTLHAAGETCEVQLPLLGDFNVANALGAAAVAVVAGQRPVDVAVRLATVPQVSGRLERLSDAPVVLRDYAHTPDALERALSAIRPFVTAGRVIVVFGCGGERDPGKRPLMGAIAERLADHVILTSDNPRREDPEKILSEIETGMQRRTHERIEDRRDAVARALDLAKPGDLVLLAGKGHETYQIRGKEKLPFDEAVVVRELLAERRK
jgi:UDP-N-acetylmuramoyl-L-alanyl-D-glutamate--2,6-diaminopimelate ligase